MKALLWEALVNRGSLHLVDPPCMASIPGVTAWSKTSALDVMSISSRKVDEVD